MPQKARDPVRKSRPDIRRRHGTTRTVYVQRIQVTNLSHFYVNLNEPLTTHYLGLCRCRRCLASRLIPSASRTWRNKTTIFSRENPISRRPCRTTAPPNRDLTKLCPGSSWAVFWVIFLVLSVANPMLWLLRQLWSNCWRRLRLAFHPLLRQSHSGVFRIRCRIPHVYEFVYLHLYYNIPTTKMGKNDIVSMLLIALIHSSSE